MGFIAKVVNNNRITLDPKEMKKQSISIGDDLFVDIKKIDHEKIR